MNSKIKIALTTHDRESRILSFVAKEADITILRMSQELGVSITTIRNDIQSLIDQGIMLKMKGNLYPAYHPQVIAQQQINFAEKMKVAEAAAQLVENNNIIMISAGTTVALIPRFLLGKDNIKIITNSTLVLPNLCINNKTQLTLLGGEFRNSSELTGGQETIRQLSQHYAKYAFIGSDGFGFDYGSTSHLADACSVAKLMFEHSEVKVLCSDSSKFNQRGFIKVAPLEEFNMIITDDKLPASAVDRIRDMGIRLILV